MHKLCTDLCTIFDYCHINVDALACYRRVTHSKASLAELSGALTEPSDR
jgi:hypothetical protein